jgi:isopentenyl phosphate kinase
MYIIKLGGSVITDKTKKNYFKQDTMDNLAKEIKRANKEIILVHGAGSFGHILAEQYNLNNGHRNDNQLLGFSLTHAMVQKLNYLVLDTLIKKDIPAVSIPPHAIIKLDNHKPLKMDYNIFKDYLNTGFVPITFGDVVLDEKLGFSICSGDLLVQLLAEKFKPEKVIFTLDEDGLYASNPKKDKNAKLIDSTKIDELEQYKTLADAHADVTGGMGGKINTIKKISKLGIDTILLNGNKPDRLYKMLIEEYTKSTIIYGDKK